MRESLITEILIFLFFHFGQEFLKTKYLNIVVEIDLALFGACDDVSAIY